LSKIDWVDETLMAKPVSEKSVKLSKGKVERERSSKGSVMMKNIKLSHKGNCRESPSREKTTKFPDQGRRLISYTCDGWGKGAWGGGEDQTGARRWPLGKEVGYQGQFSKKGQWRERV